MHLRSGVVVRGVSYVDRLDQEKARISGLFFGSFEMENAPISRLSGQILSANGLIYNGII